MCKISNFVKSLHTMYVKSLLCSIHFILLAFLICEMSFLRTLEYTKFLFCLLHNLHCSMRQDNFLFSLARSATWEFPVVTCLIEKAYISYNGWKREKEIWTNELRVVKLVYNDSTLERDAKSKRCQRLNLLVDSYFFFIFLTSFLNLLFCSLTPEISNDSRCSFALLATG
jgi:hypothetical protein